MPAPIRMFIQSPVNILPVYVKPTTNTISNVKRGARFGLGIPMIRRVQFSGGCGSCGK